MFREFFTFDLRYQLKAPLLWIGAVLFGLLAFGAVSSDAVTVGGAIGNVHRNASTVIIQFLLVFSILGMLLLAASIAGGLLRDFELGTSELFFATPMRKFDYLFGRFAAAIVSSFPFFAAIILGILIGTRMPWIDPARLGPFDPAPYLWALLVIVLPNLLLMGALLALLASSTRSMLAVYLGLLGFLTLWIVAGALMSDIRNEWVATLLDPFGARAFGRAVRYWSAAERNFKVPPLDGFILANRALWIAVAGVLLVLAYVLFKPQRAGAGRRWFGFGRRRAVATVGAAAATPPPAGAMLVRPAARPRFGVGATLATLRRQTWFDVRGVLRGVPFLVMLAFGVLNFIGASTTSSQMFGTTVYPVTYLMLEIMQGTFNFFLVMIVTFYAGELVWKERTAKLSEVVDATPVPDWVPLVAKLLALVVVVFGFMTIGSLTGIGVQVAKGFTRVEPALYVKGALIEGFGFVLMGVFALVLQVLTNNKFVGYLAVVLLLLSRLVTGALHYDHNLYLPGGEPRVVYSDMNGYGRFLVGRAWFDAYWAAFAGLLLVGAALFWVRGTSATWAQRVREARARFRTPLRVAAAALAAGFVGIGCWVFYNTNVLNEYVPGDKRMDRQARYEKDYRKYLDLPQPRITAVKSDVDIYPDQRRVAIRGHYHLVNKTDKPIPTLHVVLGDRAVEIKNLVFAPADLVSSDKDFGYRIYRLAQPLAPGAGMDFDFDLDVRYHGFTNDGDPEPVRDNGTFFNSMQYFPHFGYQPGMQLTERSERKKRGLGEVPRMPKLEDEAARANTYIANDADWIDYETTVSTSADQIALSPGYLQREWAENGRRYFHYKMDVPMMPFWAFLSARWEVKRDRWKDVPIEIYYDAKHPYNVDRMIDGAKKALDYFTTNFSPYQHKQVRILEFPRYESFAQSFANTIPYSESIGFIADLRDKEAIDYVFYVTAHEVAHQWWAHQVIGANMQGSTVLSESLSQYSALMVMEKEYGREKMQRFLRYELDGYLRERGGELVEELPLYRVENQGYIHYRKGSLVFYRLRDEIGEETLNRVLARFLKDKGYQEPPFTTSREFLEALRAEVPADRQQLVSDLFEKITFYDNRTTEVTAKKRDDGKYDVELKYEAKKFEADGKGAEKPLPLDEPIDVGVFAKPRRGSKDAPALLLAKERIKGPSGTLKLVVDAEPYEAGLDPYNKLIDRVPADNRKEATLR